MQLDHRASLALTTVKVTVAGTIGGLALAGLMVPSGTGTGSASSAERLEQTQVAAARLASRTPAPSVTDLCSTTGAPAGSALIRTETGQVRVVTFEQGWSVFKGEQPGRFVAVCSAGS